MYKTHVWNIKVDGQVLQTFRIKNEAEQEFVL